MFRKLFCLVSMTLLFACLLKAQENTPLLCSDGIDNDNDGLIDCFDSECIQFSNGGCPTCNDSGISFGDTILSQNLLCSGNSYTNAELVLGLSNYDDNPMGETFLSLGSGGSVCIGFTDNLLINSGDANPDLFVFEVGPSVEGAFIELKPFDLETKNILEANNILDTDNNGYYRIAEIGGSLSSVDIDAAIPSSAASSLKFDGVQIIDDNDEECTDGSPGADIDAVCALVFLDCAGVLNGPAVIDECGECLEMSDSMFNQSCIDCAGILNGLAVLDECGECLEMSDPMFNQSCADCAGVPNGESVLDSCQICLEIGSSEFSFECEDTVEYPNIFTPGLTTDNIFKIRITGRVDVLDLKIYDRWGNLVYDNDNAEQEWDGTFQGQPLPSEVYIYIVTTQIFGQDPVTKSSDLTLLR